MATPPSRQTLREAASGPQSGPVAVGFAVVTTLALFAVLFPWFPGGQRLEVGAIAARDISAPRDITYESAVLTERQRQAAADAIDDVLVLDTEVRDEQLAGLERILAAIEEQRRDATTSDSAKESAIRAIPGVTVSERSAATFVAVGPARWSTMQEEARDALSRTLVGAIGPEDIDVARGRLASFLSPLLTGDEILALTELLNPLVAPTLSVSQERTQALRDEARANTPPVRATYTADQVIVAAGTPIDQAAFEAITRLDISTGSITPAAVAASAIASLLAGAALGAHLWVDRPRALRGARRLALFMLTLLVPVVIAKFTFPLLLPDEGRLYLVHGLPLAAGPVIAGVLLSVGSGATVAFVLALLAGFLAIVVPSVGGPGNEYESLRLALATGAASLTALYLAARADRLQVYLGAGLAAAAAAALAALLVLMLDPAREVRDVLWIVGSCFVGGLLVATISVGVFVLLSRPFGIITRIELMELVQLNHPLLRRLQDEAPGTFQHSMLVGSLADRAADRIGADSLLVRVGAYYHDIGKLHSPGFFVENFGDGPNPHGNLDPLQSSRVIQRHVTAGIELARRHGIPEAVVSFIPQHHGTRLVAYFYREAAKVKPDIDPALFRYPGPRPRTREAALVMLADSCEATVRASGDRTAERIRQVVDGIIRERIEEGELDECPISLRDLRIVSESFTQALSAIYHPRVEYPEPTRRELEARRMPALPEPRRELGSAQAAASPARLRPADDERRTLTEDDT